MLERLIDDVRTLILDLERLIDDVRTLIDEVW
jgi:hypothetical protein